MKAQTFTLLVTVKGQEGQRRTAAGIGSQVHQALMQGTGGVQPVAGAWVDAWEGDELHFVDESSVSAQARHKAIREEARYTVEFHEGSYAVKLDGDVNVALCGTAENAQRIADALNGK